MTNQEVNKRNGNAKSSNFNFEQSSYKRIVIKNSKSSKIYLQTKPDIKTTIKSRSLKYDINKNHLKFDEQNFKASNKTDNVKIPSLGDFINWAWLFVQLIYTGVVDPDADQLLFTMVIDMFVILIHHIITLEPNLDNNKHYQSIVKKISKETKDFSDIPNTRAINHV